MKVNTVWSVTFGRCCLSVSRFHLIKKVIYFTFNTHKLVSYWLKTRFGQFVVEMVYREAEFTWFVREHNVFCHVSSKQHIVPCLPACWVHLADTCTPHGHCWGCSLCCCWVKQMLRGVSDILSTLIDVRLLQF